MYEEKWFASSVIFWSSESVMCNSVGGEKKKKKQWSEVALQMACVVLWLLVLIVKRN